MSPSTVTRPTHGPRPRSLLRVPILGEPVAALGRPAWAVDVEALAPAVEPRSLPAIAAAHRLRVRAERRGRSSGTAVASSAMRPWSGCHPGRAPTCCWRSAGRSGCCSAVSPSRSRQVERRVVRHVVERRPGHRIAVVVLAVAPDRLHVRRPLVPGVRPAICFVSTIQTSNVAAMNLPAAQCRTPFWIIGLALLRSSGTLGRGRRRGLGPAGGWRGGGRRPSGRRPGGAAGEPAARSGGPCARPSDRGDSAAAAPGPDQRALSRARPRLPRSYSSRSATTLSNPSA
jgi:hypothetical protein